MGELAYQCTNGIVASGPFKGLNYVSAAMGSTLGPKLLGTYEKELESIIEQIIDRQYKTIINIGSGEGYFAVGLASRMPGVRVICFEAIEANRALLQNLAERNNVSGQLDIRGLCTAENLAAAIGQSTDMLIICDVEGNELDILRPDQVPALDKLDILAEMHDAMLPGVSSEIDRRFKHLHDITVIWTKSRTLSDWPASVTFDINQRLAIMEESRGGPMSWFWMKAKENQDRR